MTTASAKIAELSLDRAANGRSHAVIMVQIFAVALMVLPGDYVIKAVGGNGFAAALVAYLLFILWVTATLLGQHNPSKLHYPVRVTLVGIWVVSLISYVLIKKGNMTSTQMVASERWIMQLVGLSGIVLFTAEFIRSKEDIRRVLRALTWAGAFCGIVAGLQFKARINLANYLKLPGFSVNTVAAINAAIVSRGGENRVAGTATDPIELGVAAGMLLALSAYLIMHDKGHPMWKRIVPFVCILIAVPTSVSRSGVIAVVAALGVLVISLPPLPRLKALSFVPIGIGAMFVAAHGIVGTLTSYFLAGTSDNSVAHRTNNYSYVLQLFRKAPWFGQGGGTFIPDSQVNILDNQYLTTLVELGIFGVLALLFYLAWPVVAALVARSHTKDPELKDLCASLAGAELAAVLCAATFDGFSFPIFYSLQALLAGLIGAVWLLVHETDGNSVIKEGVF